MIRVYFERSQLSQLVAVFFDEYTYNDCLPKLERLCKDMGFDKVTESIETSVATDKLTNQILNLWKSKSPTNTDSRTIGR